MRAKAKKAGQSAQETDDASHRPDDADHNRIATKIFELGGTEADVAEALNVSREKVAEWRTVRRDFSKACMQGLEKANSEVQRNLFKMANGYERMVEDVRFHQGRVTRTKYRKWFPANLAAAKIWLLNRYSEKWNSEPEPEQKENPIAQLLREIEGSTVRPVYECGTPVPFSIMQHEADESEKEAEIEKEKEMVKLGLVPYRKEQRALYNRFCKK